MAAALLPFLLLSIVALLPGQTDGAVTASVSTVSSWNGGSQVNVVLKNSGPSAICAVTYKLTLPSGTTISSSWNMEAVGNGQYKTPSWVNIPVGGQSSDGGIVLSGSGKPTVSVVSSTACGGSGSGTTTTTKSSGSGTTTTTKATTTTTKASSSGGATKTVTTDPANAAINSCLKSTATGPITSVLNQPYNNGQFTFYGAGGTGACGQDSGKPAGFSAAASGQLFRSTQEWVAPCTGTQYVLNDAICIGKCVKITYTCVGCSSAKTLIVPINNKCPECAPDHVDLSIDAFNYLEPQGGTVGIAKNAVITYIDCP